MKQRWCKGFLAAVFLAGAMPAVAQEREPASDRSVVYIHAGRLLAEPGQAPRGPATIVVRGGEIAEVRDGFAPPETGAALVDLSDDFVLPGLIDLHVHLLGPGGDPLADRLTAINRDVQDDLLQGVANARVTLLAGFTTVRDLGGTERSIRALRDASQAGLVEAPTIVNAGHMLSVTGGHGDGRNGLGDLYSDAQGHQEYVCDGVEDCARAVRRQIGLGAQVIKFAATGGVLSNVSGGLSQAMTSTEMAAIIDTAHGLGRRVAAHSHADAGTRAAVEAGVDTIEHGSFLEPETIALMKRRGTWLVPTMLATRAAVAQAEAGALPPAVVPKAREAVAAAADSHARAIDAGVKIAFGTDTGVSSHGRNAEEFVLMVAAGMTPAAAIRAATSDAAEVLGRANSVGRIAPGMTADIIAVDGDPLLDVRELEDVDFVMKAGRVILHED
ncbi:amidohydrolase family protein [Croceicoccus sp. F390]|uniref:Amidohydrolase family protein n=1 Tax=Croceicoccus esteveae TaxID=3075597 RepID=A0ABU2ZL75_9SPHN|nr:amidohydrolase family protein [Croceicoccus sp. F390]MDT0577084.1 amidohydrolase family protein [Croceicoccus sp. F390]